MIIIIIITTIIIYVIIIIIVMIMMIMMMIVIFIDYFLKRVWWGSHTNEENVSIHTLACVAPLARLYYLATKTAMLGYTHPPDPSAS